MKIALVITSLGVGGAERVVTSLADAFVERGHDVLIVFLTGEALVLPHCKSIQVVGLEMTSALSVAGAYLKLRRILKQFEPDVVHSHLFHANILARLVRVTAPVDRLINTVHNTIEGGRLRMLAYRVTDRLADISTAVSNEAVAHLVAQRAVRTGRMISLHNGISTDEFKFSMAARKDVRRDLGIDDQGKLIIAVGSLCAQKDYPNLFQALSELDYNKAEYLACIVGDGPLRPVLTNMVGALGLAQRVRFLGVRRDIPKLMSAADVFVLSSAWEGFGLVVAEAMACERIVVATDCGGVKEVVGNAGLLVPPGNAAALAAAVGTALDMPADECAELGAAARARVEKLYSLETAVSKWLELYSGT